MKTFRFWGLIFLFCSVFLSLTQCHNSERIEYGQTKWINPVHFHFNFIQYAWIHTYPHPDRHELTYLCQLNGKDGQGTIKLDNEWAPVAVSGGPQIMARTVGDTIFVLLQKTEKGLWTHQTHTPSSDKKNFPYDNLTEVKEYYPFN